MALPPRNPDQVGITVEVLKKTVARLARSGQLHRVEVAALALDDVWPVDLGGVRPAFRLRLHGLPPTGDQALPAPRLEENCEPPWLKELSFMEGSHERGRKRCCQLGHQHHMIWSRDDQALLGMHLLDRGVQLISLTTAVVSIYGLGLAGQLMAEGTPNPRAVIV
ncbi:unnamed protein product, partial [Chrysoparadoxa australica]